MGLEITIDTNMQVVNFLDVTLSIKDGKFWPYAKPNNTIKYVHTQSNHPRNITKQIPYGVNKRLCELSCDKENFDRAKPEYEKALKESGHKTKLIFNDCTETSRRKKCRSRKIIWYNPPFNSEVKTQFGKEFLKILDSNFPKKHQFNRFLNRHTIKVSYSCTKNMGAIIATHNKKILNDKTDQERDCNCRVKTNCPLKGQCCTKTVVYKAEIKTENTIKNYIGLTEGEFKTRYNEHINSFTNNKKKANTALSSLVWSSGQNPNPDITWSIVQKCNKYQPNQKNSCDLCLSEKLHILKAGKDPNNINVRNEISSICRHRNNYKLESVLKDNPGGGYRMARSTPPYYHSETEIS